MSTQRPLRRVGVILALALALTLATPIARAQNALHIGGPTASTAVRDFRPTAVGQETSWTFTASGATSATQLLGYGCFAGYVSQRPDVILRVRTPITALRVWLANLRVVSTASPNASLSAMLPDTGLVVNSADGRWHCDDRSLSNAPPQVMLTNVGVGQYDIWVGSRHFADVVAGELHVASVAFAETGGQHATLGVHELAEGAAPLDLEMPERPAGEVDIRPVGSWCAGNVPPTPDAIVRVGAVLPQLRVWATTSEDSSVILHTPDDRWRCGNTVAGRPPTAMLRDAPAGQYELWVGSRFGRPMRGAVHVSASPLVELGGDSAVHGVQTLTPAFTPDPMDIELTPHPAGDVEARLVSGMCSGRVRTRPDVIVRLDAPMPVLRAFVTAPVDTSLLVHGPEDLWRCNESSYGGFNPLVDLVNPTPGQYEIWVGASGTTQTVSGTLHLAHAPLVEVGATAGVLGARQLPAGFDGESWSLDLPARPAGDMSARVASTNCVGQIARRPDVVLDVTAALPLLRAYVVSAVDTTLLVHGPGDAWRCNDDSNVGGRNINPVVDFTNATPGHYEVWVGTFPGVAALSGTLHVTRNAQVLPPPTANPLENGNRATPPASAPPQPSPTPTPPPPPTPAPRAAPRARPRPAR